jgi:XTP/dITP diphosphohydrolase
VIHILLATRNRGKLVEFQQLLGDFPAQLLTAEDTGLGALDVEETGETLLENASLKAAAYGEASGLPTIADDTGLFVEALGGLPGIFPKRYGGPAKLLAALEGISPPRRAYFECVIALWTPDGRLQHVTGTCHGQITGEMRGEHGFGYDPIFQPDGYHETFAELGEEIKNPISHRGLATAAILPVLGQLANKT